MNKRDHPLYPSFLEVAAKGETASLDLFKDPSFYSSLDENEKNQLASLFLNKMEEGLEKVSEQNLLEVSHIAEELSGEKSDILLKLSTLLFRFGVLKDHKESLLLGLGKMVQIEEKNPQFFNQDFRAAHLWGNLLLGLHRITPDDAFLEQAITKYTHALKLAEKNKDALREIYWDLGEAYLQLGERSKELIDLKQARWAYSQAAEHGASTPHFWLDFGASCFQLGARIGHPEFIREAIQLFKGVIVKSSKENKMALTRAWVLYAYASKKLVELTHDLQALNEADHVFQEALIAVPEEASLWLAWGELFIRLGWYYRDITLLDKGLEKLTGLKVVEAEPISLSSLLTQGLAYLGILLEDIRLIKEAEKRVESIITLGKKNKFDVYLASGVAGYARGIYFNDAVALQCSLADFEKARTLDPNSTIARYMLFETSLALAELKGDKYYAKKGVMAASRAAELSPFVPLFWNNWGIALLKLHIYGKKPTLLIEQAIDKFKYAAELSPYPDLRGLFHHGVAYDLLGGIMEDEKYYEQSIQLLSQVLEKIPDSLAVRHQLALSYLHYAEITADPEPLHRSVDLFESVVAQDSEDESAYCGLGAALLCLSELIGEPDFTNQGKELKERAEKALLKALELGNAEANYHLATLYSLTGLLEKSIFYLERSAKGGSLPCREDVLEDEWLEAVRGTEEFERFFKIYFEGGDHGST